MDLSSEPLLLSASQAALSSLIAKAVPDLRDVNAVAAQIARKQAGRLAQTLTKSKQRRLQVVVARSLDQGWSDTRTQDAIAQVVGLDARYAAAVEKYRAGLMDGGMSPGKAKQAATSYAKRLLKHRAAVIARSEIQQALGDAQRLLWEQQQKDQDLSRYAVRVWQVHKDERRCVMCKPMNGRRASLQQGGGYNVPGVGWVTGPPLHPQCRCFEKVVDQGIAKAAEVEALPLVPVVIEKHLPGMHDQDKHGNRGLGRLTRQMRAMRPARMQVSEGKWYPADGPAKDAWEVRDAVFSDLALQSDREKVKRESNQKIYDAIERTPELDEWLDDQAKHLFETHYQDEDAVRQAMNDRWQAVMGGKTQADLDWAQDSETRSWMEFFMPTIQMDLADPDKREAVRALMLHAFGAPDANFLIDMVDAFNKSGGSLDGGVAYQSIGPVTSKAAARKIQALYDESEMSGWSDEKFEAWKYMKKHISRPLVSEEKAMADTPNTGDLAADAREVALRWNIRQIIDTWAGTSGDSDRDALGLQAAAHRLYDTGDLSSVKRYAGSSVWRDVESAFDDRGVMMLHFLDATYRVTQADLEARGIEEVVLYRGMDGGGSWADRPEGFAPTVTANINGTNIPVDRLIGEWEVRDGTSGVWLYEIGDMPGDPNVPIEPSPVFDSYYEYDEWMQDLRRQQRAAAADRHVTLSPLSSWSADINIAEGFMGGSNPVILTAVIPRERIISGAVWGLGCLPEREYVILGHEGTITVNWRERY